MRGATFAPHYVEKHHLTDDQPQFITQKLHIFLQKVHAIINPLKYQ